VITPFQRSVAAMFFSLDESAGFAVAGGAALIARALVDRSTRDVDLFTTAPPAVPIPDVVSAFTRAAVTQGWLVRQLRLSDTFARLAVEGEGDVTVVDLGLDSPPDEPPSITELGPTLAARDLAARKVLALFGRAEARDFADVRDLADVYPKDELLLLARAQDGGFDLGVFADMIGTATRYSDDELSLSTHDAAQLRRFFRDWREELQND